MTDGHLDDAAAPVEQGPARRWLPIVAGGLAGLVVLATIGAVTGWVLAGGSGGGREENQAGPDTATTRPPAASATPSPTPAPSRATALPDLPAGRFPLPNLVGKDFRKARTELRKLGLGWQLTFGAAGDDPAVASTDPRPGTSVRRGTTVRLSVLGAAPEVKVPGLVGLPCAKAAARLIDVGLYPDYPTGRLGPVTQQDPEPKTRLRWNDRVALHCGRTDAQPSASAHG